MVKGPEKLRLLLVTNNVGDQQQTPGQRPHYRGNCFLFVAAQTLCVLTFFAFLAFIAIRVAEIEKDITQKEKETLENTIPGSDFCKSVNAENMSLVALGYLTGIKGNKNELEAKNKVYYVTDRFFTDQEACAIEALLRLLQDKTIFIIEIGNFTETNHSKTDYIQFLREHYTNLNQIKSTTDKFFKGSPFQNYLKNVDGFSIFAAKVLLVWQFGGSVLSPNFLLLSRRLFDNNEGFCEVDRELLFCPNQCSAYVYQLVKTILDMLRIHQPPPITQESLQHIIDKSVADYCGSQQATGVGCIGINRIKAYSVCQKLNKGCEYLRVQEWKIKDQSWKTVIQKFCPKIVTHYMPHLMQMNEKRNKNKFEH